MTETRVGSVTPLGCAVQVMAVGMLAVLFVLGMTWLVAMVR
jgi:hypothetical protein